MATRGKIIQILSTVTGIEPRSPVWQARILPLNQQYLSRIQLFIVVFYIRLSPNFDSISSNCKSFKMLTRTSKRDPPIWHFTASQCANHVENLRNNHVVTTWWEGWSWHIAFHVAVPRSHHIAITRGNHIAFHLISVTMCHFSSAMGVRTLVPILTAIFKNWLDRSGFEPLTFGLPVVSLNRSTTTLLQCC